MKYAVIWSDGFPVSYYDRREDAEGQIKEVYELSLAWGRKVTGRVVEVDDDVNER